jgi:hypothetical protein
LFRPGLCVLLHRPDGASSFELAGTFIVSLIILMFYGRKMHQRQHENDTLTALPPARINP